MNISTCPVFLLEKPSASIQFLCHCSIKALFYVNYADYPRFAAGQYQLYAVSHFVAQHAKFMTDYYLSHRLLPLSLSCFTISSKGKGTRMVPLIPQIMNLPSNSANQSTTYIHPRYGPEIFGIDLRTCMRIQQVSSLFLPMALPIWVSLPLDTRQ